MTISARSDSRKSATCLSEDHTCCPTRRCTVYVEFAAVLPGIALLRRQPADRSTSRPPRYSMQVKQLRSAISTPRALRADPAHRCAGPSAARRRARSDEAHLILLEADAAAEPGGSRATWCARRSCGSGRPRRARRPARAPASAEQAPDELLGPAERLQPPATDRRREAPGMAQAPRRRCSTRPTRAPAGRGRLALTICKKSASTTSARSTRWIWSNGAFRRASGRSSGRCRASGVVRIATHASPPPSVLTMARLSDDDRKQFAACCRTRLQRSEEQVARRFRPLLPAALQDVGLNPGNPPEADRVQQGRRRMLDRIIASGFLTFGDLRDTLSRRPSNLPIWATRRTSSAATRCCASTGGWARCSMACIAPARFTCGWLERSPP